MTNFEYIKSLPIELLAKCLAYGGDYHYTTTDEYWFLNYQEAIEHELQWLKMQHEETEK